MTLPNPSFSYYGGSFYPQIFIMKHSKTVTGLVLVIAVLGIVWLLKAPTDQELLANTAKAADFHPWKGWWSSLFLGGSSQATGLTTGLFYLILKIFMFPLGQVAGTKIAVLSAVLLGGLGVAAFLRRWIGDECAAWLGAVAFVLGPQMSLRLAGSEHLPVVFAMAFAPWVLWALLGLVRRTSWKNSMILALCSAGMTLTFAKLAIAFAPLALFFTIHLLAVYPERRNAFLRFLGHTLLLYVPLAVIILLPTIREMQWLALFKFDPFAAWQQNFSIRSVISWLDRDNVLLHGMPPGFVSDQGGFYVGIIALAVGLLAWWRAIRSSAKPESEGEQEALILTALKVVFGMLLFLSWMSAGPRSLAQGLLDFLKSATPAPDLTIPLFWLVTVAQCVLLWVLWPRHAHRDYARIAALLVFLGVPGFRLYELLPFARDIRAPWSVWQVGGSLASALLFGIGGSLLIKSWEFSRRHSGSLSLILVALMAIDYSGYLMRYGKGALPPGTYGAFEQICSSMRQAPDRGGIYPLSGRYFYLQLPSLTGNPIEQEAFNSYFGLSWRRSLQGAMMSSPDAIRVGMSLLGCSYIFIDKQDPNTAAEVQKAFRGLFPRVLENSYFAILSNPQSLYPAFLAHDFVIFPRDSYAGASPAVIQLTPRNFITVEMADVDQSKPGFAGMAKSGNQVELLPRFKGKNGEPFQRVPLSEGSLENQRRVYRMPPSSSGWLVETEAYHPDWTATIDGKTSTVYRADGTLLATFVPPGSHEVVFEFRAPFWYGVCMVLGVLSWIIAVALQYFLTGNKAPKKWRLWWNAAHS